jgi:glycosyltransferase involved in cell wall biosynthesis
MIAPFGIRPKGTLLARMLPLGQALQRRGHSVRIVAPPVQNPQDAATSREYDGVSVEHVGLARLPGSLDWSVSLLRAARASQPDLLHLFKPKGFGGLAALFSRFGSDLPLVVDTDDWEGWGGWNDLLPYPYPAKQLFAWQESDLPRRAAAVTVASRTLQSQIWGFGVAPERVFYVPNGITATALPPPTAARDRYTLLLYTRFWEFDLPDLVTSLVAILQQQAAARLIVIGKGERGEEEQMLQLAERAGVRAAIDYRGWVEPEQIPALLAKASIALVPVNDSLINRARCSAKLLELIQAGLTIVASDVGQMREYLCDHQTGLLVAPNDPAGMAQAVLTLMNDQALRDRLSKAARLDLARFDWDALAPSVEAAYQVALYNEHISQPLR